MFVSVYITAPSMAHAKRLARAMLDARLAACANAWPIASWYWWEGKKESAREAALLFKTRRALVPKLTRALKAEHDYDVPCVVAWPIAGGNKDYFGWIAAETRARPRTARARGRR